MTSSDRDPAAGLELLEIGLRWPPETFVQDKLIGLAQAGVHVTVASTVPRSRASTALPGVRLVRIPRTGEPPLRWIPGAVGHALRLAVTHPRRFRRLVRAIRVPSAPSAAPLAWRFRIKMLRRLARLACMSPDIVHFEWESAAGFYFPVLAVWDVPVVVSCRGSLHFDPYVPGNERWVRRLPQVFARASAVHCVSEAMRREVVARGVEHRRTRVIRPAVAPRWLDAPALSAESTPTLRLVSVGDLTWRKGHEYTLQTLALLERCGIPAHLDLVGGLRADLPRSSHEQDRVLETIADLRLAQRVAVHGRLTPAQVRNLLGSAHVYVHSSLAEGIPNSVLEAMACGVAVVATDCDGTSEAVRHEREGLLVPARDSPAAAQAIGRLWRDDDLRRRLAQAARLRVESQFTLASRSCSWLELYRDVHEAGPLPISGVPRPHALDPAGVEPSPAAPDPIRLLTIGALSWRGGHEWLLQALRLLLDRGLDCRLRIVGRGEHAQATAFAVHQLRLAEAVEIVDAGPSELQINRHRRWADVYLDSAVVPGSDVNAEEAATGGLPLVGTSRTTLSPAVAARDTVRLVAPREPASMASAVAELSAALGDARMRALGS